MSTINLEHCLEQLEATFEAATETLCEAKHALSETDLEICDLEGERRRFRKLLCKARSFLEKELSENRISPKVQIAATMLKDNINKALKEDIPF